MSRKVKLQALHVFMAMILLIGIIQPGFVFAMDEASAEEEITEETDVEGSEAAAEEDEIEEVEVPEEAETAEEIEEVEESAEESETIVDSEGVTEAEVQTEVEEDNEAEVIVEEETVAEEIAEETTEEIVDEVIEVETAEEEIITLAEEVVEDEYIEDSNVDPVVEDITVSETEFEFELSPERISQWDLARGGVDFELDAPVGEDVTVTIADYKFEFVSRWLYSDTYVLDLSPGTYPVEVTIEGTTVTENLQVVSDDAFWEETTNPSAFSRTNVLTKSEAEEMETVRVESSGFPQHAYVDVLVNGNQVETLYTDWGIYGSVVAFVDVTELPVGEHSIEFVHPTGSAERTLFIVSDETGEIAPEGTYAGLTYQHTGGSQELDDPFELPITFEVDENGVLQNLEVEYWWVCVFGGGSSGISTAEDITPTQIKVNEPFQINWEEGASEYSFVGVIHEDGTASGSFYNYLAACGYGVSDWNLASDVTPPDPQPDEFDVELDLDTTEETEGPVTITVTTTSDAEITSLKWLDGDRTEDDFANAGNEIDLATMSFTVEENGTYSIYALNADGIASLSTITISNIMDPDDGADPGNGGDPGDDPDPGNGSDPGDGTDPDDGSDPGDDTDSGDGSDPGDDTDSGDSSDSGDDTDSGDGSGSGDATDSGDGSDPSEDTDSGEGTDGDGNGNGNGETLPATATNMFNLLLIGGALVMLGLAFLFLKRKQNA